MNIDVKLGKEFTEQYNKLQSKYGEQLALLNGFGKSQLSYTDFIDNFIDEKVVGDSSIDANSNVRRKDIVTLLSEMPKPHRKLLAFNKIYHELQKEYGTETANEWVESDYKGELYLHDSDTSTFKNYCFAHDLKDLAEKGLFFLAENFNAKPPQHLETFIDFVKEYISYTSNRSSGENCCARILFFSLPTGSLKCG